MNPRTSRKCIVVFVCMIVLLTAKLLMYYLTTVGYVRPAKFTQVVRLEELDPVVRNYSLVPTQRQNTTISVEIFPAWTTTDPYDVTFIRRVYIYSAIKAIHNTPSTGTEIHIVAFQEGKVLLPLTCCAMLSGGVYQGDTVKADFSKHEFKLKSTPRDLVPVGVVYRCRIPVSEDTHSGALHVTLTNTSCPVDESSYLTVHEPELRPGKLAICAKIAFGHNLNPQKLVEWFEMQRLLGVDKIELFDLNDVDIVRRIFQHYQRIGLLDLMPYKLPVKPWDRNILRGTKEFSSYGQEKDVPIWECRLRLAGYDYVIGIDMDEIVIPRHFTRLKPFIEDQFKRHPKAASLFFNVQFFIDSWSPVDPKAPLHFLQYLNSTPPRWERYKYIYIPSRVHQAVTHRVMAYPGYERYKVPPAEATLFHYRKCPREWRSCYPESITDRAMLKFQDDLLPAVEATKRDVGL